VPPDQVISPYERTLNTMPVLGRSAMRTLRPLLGRTAIARAVLISFLIGGFCGQANSQSNPATPVDEFAQEYKKLKDSLASLPKRIEDTGRSVDQNTNPENAKTQIDTLRGIVSTVLAQVADNGPVSKMGQDALDFARSKLKEMEQDTHFTKEQRDFLTSQWQSTTETTEAAVKDLDDARKELSGLLRVLQSNEDFMQELEALSNAAKTIEVLRALTNDMREISNHLRNLIKRMTVPSM
jgi:chromosome segregation ATPase